MRKKAIGFIKFNQEVIAEYISDNVIKYSASLAYYTTLSLAPMLIIIIYISGLLFGKEAMKGEVYSQLKDLVGSDAAIEIQSTIQNIHFSKETPVTTIISFIVLLIGATGIFAEIQDSLNKIWGLKLINKSKWWKLILDRLVSFSLIISMGFIMVVSLLLSAVTLGISNKISENLGGIGQTMVMLLDTGLSLLLTTIVFATIFKVLPDARIKWKDVFIGSLITSILFMIGKVLIGIYVAQSNLATMFGAAGSIIIIMLWVYYSSATLYLGAVFTKIYAVNFGGKIFPSEYSTWVKVQEIPMAKPTLNE